MSRVPLIALAGLLLATTLAPASARTRHRHHPSARASGAARPRAAASHAAIPQNANIETLNDLSLRRARSGENTSRALVPPLAQ